MSNFTIKSVKILSTWNFNIRNNTDCTICRVNLNSDSIYAQEKGIDSCIVTGMCGHNFHHECIDPWIKSNPHCPICSQKWTYTK
jgi:hypothetical protein